jgi:hypothetical protein
MATIRLQGVIRARELRFRYAERRAIVKIQASIRMQHERGQYDLIKSAKLIKRTLRACLVRRFLRELIGVYKGAARSNQWGRGLRDRWPKAPCVVNVDLLLRMESAWRVKRLLSSIKGREGVYREKVLAYDTFRGKKPWEPGALWGDHNYLASELNPTQAAFKSAFAVLPSGDKKVYFSDLVDKMNPNGKMVERAIMLTEQGFYRMTPGKYKPDKHNELADIKAISITTQNDNLVVLHHGSLRDSVINLTFYIGSGAKKQLRRTRSFSNIGGKGQSVLLAGARQSMPPNNNNNNNNDPMLGLDAVGDDESERHSEFVMTILMAMKEANLPAPLVTFTDHISINVSKKGDPKMVSIRAVPKTSVPNSTWEVGKDHTIYSSQK